MDAYLALEHVLVTGRRRGGGYEDIALGRLGMSRRIRVRCQHYAAAYEIVARSDLLATMARSQAELGSRQDETQVLPLPAGDSAARNVPVLARERRRGPGSQWLRAALLELMRK
jgi:DNA-binding transcriptional LysR family regulator